MNRRNCRIHIDQDALQHNLDRVRHFLEQHGSSSRIMAVIKANAYGHGMFASATALDGADAFAVASAGEALALRGQGIDKPLVVLHGFATPEQLQQLAAQAIQPVVHCQTQLDVLAAYRGEPVVVWLKIDTGMHRLGIPLADWRQAVDSITACKQASLAGVMSHFANADNEENLYNNRQLEEFIKVKYKIDAPASLANSAAICSQPASCFDWVRPGIMLYGASPLQQHSAAALGLRPVMHFESRLIAIQHLKRGDAVGYGGLWHCPEDMPVGIVAAGYGDGYPRHANAGTPLWVNGQSARLVGRVSMDSLFADLRGIKAAVGDPVELWGARVPVDEVAQNAGTIAYEVLCQAGNAAALQ